MTLRLSPVPLALVLLTIAIATLTGALAFEYIGGLAPCPLCLQQRIPYWCALVLLPVFLFAFHRSHFASGTGLMMLLALGFTMGSMLAFYHAGIEWRWWMGPSTCSSGAPPADIETLLENLQNGGVPRCDEAPWRLAGISLSGYNVIISAFLAALGFIITKQCWRKYGEQQEKRKSHDKTANALRV